MGLKTKTLEATRDAAHDVFWKALAGFDVQPSRALWKLWQATDGDGEVAWHLPARKLRELELRPSTLQRLVSFRAKTDPRELVESWNMAGIRCQLPDDPERPAGVRELSEPPFVLFIRGAIEALLTPAVAIVGSRRATTYGIAVAKELATALALQGVCVASGLAFGIDRVAHEATLAAHGRTVAVLGSGIDDDCIAPRTHLPLSERILESGGALIAESPPGTVAAPFHFPLRNRLISAISRAVVVVEAGLPSGALITAKCAADQGRDVYAVPGPITSEQSAGTNRLMADGAFPCLGAEDLLERLRLPKHKAQKQLDLALEPAAKRILNETRTPIHTDDLARRLKLPVAAVMAELTRLELLGCVELDASGLARSLRAPPANL